VNKKVQKPQTDISILNKHIKIWTNPWWKLSIQNLKVQCKEVKNTTSLLSVIMLLIERHVSAYSKAIIRFNKC